MKHREKAKWIEDGKAYFCSNCGDNPLLNIEHEIEFSDYCPHCGCEMIEVVKQTKHHKLDIDKEK